MPVKDGQIFCSHEGVDEAVWECRLSGQSKITFEEAQKSEEKHRQILAVSDKIKYKTWLTVLIFVGSAKVSQFKIKKLISVPKSNPSPNSRIFQFQF